MKRLAILGAVLASILVAGCQNESKKTTPAASIPAGGGHTPNDPAPVKKYRKKDGRIEVFYVDLGAPTGNPPGKRKKTRKVTTHPIENTQPASKIQVLTAD